MLFNRRTTIGRDTLGVQLTTFLFGIAFPACAVTWSLYGAGIYGKTLKYYNGELRLVFCFLVICVAIATVAAAKAVSKPIVAIRLLQWIAILCLIFCARYLWSWNGRPEFSPHAFISAFILPTVMTLLVRGNTRYFSAIPRSMTLERRRLLQFSIRDALVGTMVLAIGMTHGRLAAPPQSRPTILIRAIDSFPRFTPRDPTLGEIATKLGTRIESPRVAEIGWFNRGASGDTYHLLARPGIKQASADEPMQIADVEHGWRVILGTLQTRELQYSDAHGLEGSSPNSAGFSLLYRTRDREGLLQVSSDPSDITTNMPNAMKMRLHERARIRWLSIRPDRLKYPRTPLELPE